MESLSILKFWRNSAPADVGSDGDSSTIGTGKAIDDARNSVLCTDEDEETDEEESFFDLVLKSPKSVDAEGGDEALKKDSRFNESPRDVFLSRNDVSHAKSRPSSQISVVRSPPKFKVFMFGFKKASRCDKNDDDSGDMKAVRSNQVPKMAETERSNKFYGKWRVEELQSSSVFARDNSLRSKILKERFEFDSSDVVSTEKPYRDSVPKYLKLIKPLYGKVSKRQNEKENRVRSFLTPSASPVTAPVDLSRITDGSRAGSFKTVSRNLVKIRSGYAPQPEIRRRDDSLLEQHDGIQGAILHCKKSFNASSREITRLIHFSSNLHENSGRNSCEELKRCSI